MRIVLRISRSDPAVSASSRDQDFAVDVDPAEPLLDALIRVKARQDGSLSFRHSCGHGVCGSDAMVIAGKERLACKTLVREVAEADGAVVTIAPLKHLPVQRDLMVDQSRFFSSYRAVKPFLINPESPAGKERIQTPQERAAFEDATSCILCGACYSACPVFEKNGSYLGPAALLSAARFTFDNRDRGLGERRSVLDDPNGAWACENHFDCTRVCPREIKVTKAINLTKNRLKKEKEKTGS
jgi:succinate dehydrogenase / fumarate reductase iron-sulfur subunit